MAIEDGKECVGHLVAGAELMSFDFIHACLPEMSSWTAAFVATATVSILPNILLVVIPSKWFENSPGKKKAWFNVANLLLCFAVAGLLGDVFLHIIPHLLGAHSHSHGGEDHGHSHGHGHAHNDHDDHGHSGMGVGDILQNCLSSVAGAGSGECHDHHDDDHHHDHHDDHHGHHDDDHHHDHHHFHSEPHTVHRVEHHDHDDHHHHGSGHKHHQQMFSFLTKDIFAILGMERALVIQIVILFGFLVFFITDKAAKIVLGSDSHGHSHSHSHGENDKKDSTQAVSDAHSDSWVSKLTASGWLNLLADSMHNFTDGVAIGASFASGRGLAVATFLSVVCHEIPHEIGDFSILVSSGLS